MKKHKKTITTPSVAAVLLITVLMTGCVKLSGIKHSLSSKSDTSDESGTCGVYVKLERSDVRSIALHGGNFTKACENADGSLLKSGEWIFTGDDIAKLSNRDTTIPVFRSRVLRRFAPAFSK